MPKGQLYINDTDAYEMGISMDSSALSALMTPPSKKEWVTNAVRGEVGEEYLKSEVPKADKRQRTDIVTGDGVLHAGTPTCIQGAAGAAGAAGRSIKSVQEQYYLSTSRTAQSGGSWQTAQPAWSAGRYVWTRSLITYSDNTTGYSSATLSELFNKANETAATASSTAAAAQTAATTAKNAADTANSTANAAHATANSAIALAGDPDNVFTDQFLTGLSNTSDVAPPKGKARLCNKRDNWFGNEIAVSQGAKVVIEATVMRHPSDTSTIPPRFGLWLTDKDDNINPWGWYSLGEDMGVVGMAADWHKWRRVATVPGGMRKGRFFLQIERSATLDGQNTQGSFYVSNIVVKMEARDYLREALEEASSGTTDVSGGLVLSKMMSVRDANGVMVAGMSGASAASNGELPMIWAGAAANTTSGIDGASFRIYSDGRAVMRNANIVGTSGAGNAVVINGAAGKIELGKSNGDGIAGNAFTEIVADTYASAASALSSRGGGGNVSGTITANGSFRATLADAIDNSPYYCKVEKTHVLGLANIPSGTPGGTLFINVPAGTLSGDVALTIPVAQELSEADSWTQDFDFTVSVSLYKNNSVLEKIEEKSVRPSPDYGDTRRLWATFNKIGTTALSMQSAYVGGDSFSVRATIRFTCQTGFGGRVPVVSTFSAMAAVYNDGVRYSNSRQVYNNVLFGNGMLMSNKASNYIVVMPSDQSVMEASAGPDAASARMLRLSPKGLLFKLGVSSAWFQANPIVYACKMNFENNSYYVRDEYNPHNLSVSAQKTSNGVVTVKHNFGKVNLPQVTAISPDRWLFAHVQSYDSNVATVRLIDRDGSFWNVPFVLTLLDFNRY